MFTILQKTWALFFGFALISLAHGLQGTLIGVRSVIEEFTFVSAGLIIAGYYIGYLTGALTIPIFLQRVGHIRVFAALASLASIAILLHSVFLQSTLPFFLESSLSSKNILQFSHCIMFFTPESFLAEAIRLITNLLTKNLIKNEKYKYSY